MSIKPLQLVCTLPNKTAHRVNKTNQVLLMFFEAGTVFFADILDESGEPKPDNAPTHAIYLNLFGEPTQIGEACVTDLFYHVALYAPVIVPLLGESAVDNLLDVVNERLTKTPVAEGD